MASSLSFSSVFNVMREAYGNHEANQKYEAENILEELEGQKRLNEPSHNISFSDYDDSDDNETFHTHPNNSILSDVYPVSPDHDMVDDNIMVTEIGKGSMRLLTFITQG